MMAELPTETVEGLGEDQVAKVNNANAELCGDAKQQKLDAHENNNDAPQHNDMHNNKTLDGGSVNPTTTLAAAAAIKEGDNNVPEENDDAKNQNSIANAVDDDKKCEDVFNPLLDKLQNIGVVDAANNINEVLECINLMIQNVHILTPTYIETHPIGQRIKAVRSLFKNNSSEEEYNNSHVKAICKQFSIAMKKVYTERVELEKNEEAVVVVLPESDNNRKKDKKKKKKKRKRKKDTTTDYSTSVASAGETDTSPPQNKYFPVKKACASCRVKRKRCDGSHTFCLNKATDEAEPYSQTFYCNKCDKDFQYTGRTAQASFTNHHSRCKGPRVGQKKKDRKVKSSLTKAFEERLQSIKSEDRPDIGPGWVRKTVPRNDPTKHTKVDYHFISPTGERFTKLWQAMKHAGSCPQPQKKKSRKGVVPFKKKVVPTPIKKNTGSSYMNTASSPKKEKGIDNPWASLGLTEPIARERNYMRGCGEEASANIRMNMMLDSISYRQKLLSQIKECRLAAELKIKNGETKDADDMAVLSNALIKEEEQKLQQRPLLETDDDEYLSDDECCICEDGGELICCDGPGCDKAYHAKCVKVDASNLPMNWYGPCCDKSAGLVSAVVPSDVDNERATIESVVNSLVNNVEMGISGTTYLSRKEKQTIGSRTQAEGYSRLAIGARILVDFRGSPYKATIRKHRENLSGQNDYLIHYDGHKKGSVTWITDDMILGTLDDENEVNSDRYSYAQQESMKTTNYGNIKLPPIENSISNKDPTAIDIFGFVNVSSILPQSLVGDIYQDATEKVSDHKSAEAEALAPTTTTISSSNKKRKRKPDVEVISNALQIDLSAYLLQQVESAVRNCSKTATAMKTVFGKKGELLGTEIESNYDGFVIETPKIIVSEPGSPPQIPHADDHCASSLFCIVHLQDGQESTCVAKYDRTKDYPTGITVSCDRCHRMEQLPDVDFRRGVHLTSEEWHCGKCDDTQLLKPQARNIFEAKVATAFGELLDDDATSLCDSYAGGKISNAGGGMLGLPMLIHRGPGNPSSSNRSRYVLFFTLRPTYGNTTTNDDTDHHKYNPSIQIHASCVLFNQYKRVKTTYEGSGGGLDQFVNALNTEETQELRWEKEQLELKNKRLQEEIRQLRKEVQRKRYKQCSG